MDLAETSLVTRVCSGDGALILSTIQAACRQMSETLDSESRADKPKAVLTS